MISDFREAAIIIFQKLPQFGMFHLGLRLQKFLTKILPQFGMFAFVRRLQKFYQKFCHSLDIRSSPDMIARKMFGSVVLPMSI